MNPVSIIATVLSIALSVYVVVLFARFVLDLARVFARQWRPRGLGLVLAEFVYTLTDPPIRFVRRFVRPVRVGGVAIDFAFSIVFIACLIAQWVLAGFV
ncbi:MAG: YggT family protein [Actinomycetota bacterium]|nr:YggT family protein [Actinomycetota bacterium]